LVACINIRTNYFKIGADDDRDDHGNGRSGIIGSKESTLHGRVYKCGWPTPSGAIFPDYESIEARWDPKIHNSTTKNDILVYGMHGPCTMKSSSGILQQFNGKVLYINDEPHGNIFNDNEDSALNNPKQYLDHVYLFGPFPVKQPKKKYRALQRESLQCRSHQHYTTKTIITNLLHDNCFVT
jgi:hypothetical protein